ncbi:hypothetical protein GCM10022140_07770 [Rhodococcus aetherivorans]
MLAGQVGASTGPGARRRDAASLAAEGGRFEDGDLEAAFDQFVGGRQACYPAAEHGDAPAPRAQRGRARCGVSGRGRDRDRAQGGEEGAAGKPGVEHENPPIRASF